MTLAFAMDWLNLLFRWAHLIVGIAWIGTSFYFIALDLSLRKREKMKKGVFGTAWEVHGGGFYHVEKYTVAPKELPDDLIWYKWEAYLTWVTGFALLVVQYYFNASAYLIDPSVLELTAGEAILISVASLVLGWLIYDRLCRSPIGNNTLLLAVCVFALIMAATYMFTHVYSGRGALIHVGAFMGTIMAVNVFGVIIPNQKKIVASLMKGEAPDPALGAMGKQRSIHNNYLTLPVLLMMVSNHYPMLTGHPQSWLLVALVLVIGGMVRHLLNRHDAGDSFAKFWWTLPGAAAGLVLALIMTAPRDFIGGDVVADATAVQITQLHCAACHAQNPTYDGFEEAPKNIHLETAEDLRRYADLVMAQAVQSDAMPLGNESGMSDEERVLLGTWLAQQD
ncbi:putative membrane protein [Roseibium hamelinense]|uniref:Putative membrane protein n=1 Tax=Roseibium hamelinense TaxID=150831 RepID=A0A562TIJ1_9HYPH|nr:urate hydroxylase PuuD [Roseibium hamelinense]MTI45820.1 cysteine desulfurase [Roseibium hamelinense]TWI92998.1 putative membrane protein [Roseibium hamelinense]